MFSTVALLVAPLPITPLYPSLAISPFWLRGNISGLKIEPMMFFQRVLYAASQEKITVRKMMIPPNYHVFGRRITMIFVQGKEVVVVGN